MYIFRYLAVETDGVMNAVFSKDFKNLCHFMSEGGRVMERKTIEK